MAVVILAAVTSVRCAICHLRLLRAATQDPSRGQVHKHDLSQKLPNNVEGGTTVPIHNTTVSWSFRVGIRRSRIGIELGVHLDSRKTREQ